ncbi:type VI secretion system baseplate subunit TssG [Sphingomonas sp.]|uniref:type VI secretion system baseplate subunit TssG n=1 Tax=Sphingomonas sp. TaxID=28214 RepID=UPI002DD63B4F|nr:type VI secretion system baseplate subunit TssG [Sphingomonas sp.]
MAPPDRPPAHHLTFLDSAAGDVRRWGMFPLVRGAEARAPGLPRVGRSRRPTQNVVDLAQDPALHFPAPTLSAVERRHGRAEVTGYWFGLLGPMGPMPIHLSEFATYERRYAKVRPFGRWLDVLAGRMLQLFYRAWGDTQPAVQADRPDDDRFARYLGALSGAAEGVAGDSVFPERARLHYAALFASRRSAVAIEDALCHLLRQPVRVLEYQPRWRDIAPEDQSRLGRGFSTLGSDMLAGKRVLTASDAFRIVIRANSIAEYEALLPNGTRFAIVSEALDAFAPSHLEWDIAIELDSAHARPVKLDGRSRLGWTGWMKPDPQGGLRRDTHLTRRMKPAKRTKGETTA